VPPNGVNIRSCITGDQTKTQSSIIGAILRFNGVALRKLKSNNQNEKKYFFHRKLFSAVIRRFFCNINIVRMALSHTSIGNLNKGGVL